MVFRLRNILHTTNMFKFVQGESEKVSQTLRDHKIYLQEQFCHWKYSQNACSEKLKGSFPTVIFKELTQEWEEIFWKTFSNRNIIDVHAQRNYSKELPPAVMQASHLQNREWCTFAKDTNHFRNITAISNISEYNLNILA